MSLGKTQKDYWINLIIKQLNELSNKELEKLGTSREELIDNETVRYLHDSGVGELLDRATEIEEKIEVLQEELKALETEAYVAVNGDTPYNRYSASVSNVRSSARKRAANNVSIAISTDPQYAEVQRILDLAERVPIKINLETSPTRLGEWLKEILPTIGVDTDIDL